LGGGNSGSGVTSGGNTAFKKPGIFFWGGRPPGARGRITAGEKRGLGGGGGGGGPGHRKNNSRALAFWAAGWERGGGQSPTAPVNRFPPGGARGAHRFFRENFMPWGGNFPNPSPGLEPFSQAKIGGRCLPRGIFSDKGGAPSSPPHPKKKKKKPTKKNFSFPPGFVPFFNKLRENRAEGGWEKKKSFSFSGVWGGGRRAEKYIPPKFPPGIPPARFFSPPHGSAGGTQSRGAGQNGGFPTIPPGRSPGAAKKRGFYPPLKAGPPGGGLAPGKKFAPRGGEGFSFP